MGLVSFWISDEYTAGSVDSNSFGHDGLSKSENIRKRAMHSRGHVLSHEKYRLIFGEYSDALGI